MAGSTSNGWGSSAATQQAAMRNQTQNYAYGNAGAQAKTQASSQQNSGVPKAMPRGATDIGTKLQAISTAAEFYRQKCKRKILGRKALFRLEGKIFQNHGWQKVWIKFLPLLIDVRMNLNAARKWHLKRKGRVYILLSCLSRFDWSSIYHFILEIIAYHLRTGMSEFSDRHDMDIFSQIAEQVLLIIARAHAKIKIDELQQIASPEGFSFYSSSRNRWVLKNLQTLFQRYSCQQVKDRLLDAQYFEKSLFGVLQVVSYKWFCPITHFRNQAGFCFHFQSSTVLPSSHCTY